MTNIINPTLPHPHDKHYWGQLYGSSHGLVITQAAKNSGKLIVVITADTRSAMSLEHECRFFGAGDDNIPLLTFPDWETLPYDAFSPHQDIISERLLTLYHLPSTKRGILIVPVSTVMHRLPPKQYLESTGFFVNLAEQINLEQLRSRLVHNGYQLVSQVYEHGEFAVRGSIIDIFPMGGIVPYRIELFDDEVESIRTFDTENQRSLDKVDFIRLLPAREFPLTEEAITQFRQAYRAAIEGDPQSSIIYRDISNGITPAGIEYYLPLFFQETQLLFDYLPEETLFINTYKTEESADHFWDDVKHRHEQLRYNTERPLLDPAMLFLQTNELFHHIGNYPNVRLQSFKTDDKPGHYNFQTSNPEQYTFDAKAAQPAEKLKSFIAKYSGRILFTAESTGRRESLLDILKGVEIHPANSDNWQSFFSSDANIAITTAPLEQGLQISDPDITVIAESQLFGEQIVRQRQRKAKQKDPDLIIRNLVELDAGAPVVHEDHGVGRYIGLRKISHSNIEQEFLTLEYAGKDKLYVPVASLHLISRYTGASPEAAPLHKLGTNHWEKAKRKAREKAHDVAAELLDIYARREAREGHCYKMDDEAYSTFANAFPFEETPDQHDAIDGVMHDMTNKKPMDRLVCGDVGFGKTEVAMRAAFIAIQDGKQVAMLVPTTLLSQQHYENFKDRFADWPVKIEALSRFRSKKEQTQILKDLESGSVDIIIGTHKLLQDSVKYKRLGLVIIDEEHRFGVRQKDKFKALRSEVDLLTLTATPIPRTLNMSLSGLRDLSIIATAPARRLAVKTFVSEWNDTLVQEACLREIRRGGQVFFLHNQVETIEKMAHNISTLLPEANVEVAHGQMRERQLEKVMADFYHQRFNILVCTTIIETGIDVPNANTIIMNRADRFGLAQLYQLRGRVGRSHHQAYAYLIVPSRKTLTPDAVKRLEAIESIEDLGAGFTLATHDLEIRGSGELLGDEQSGQMQEIGFSMYMELLERAVNALKAGTQADLDRPLDHGSEVDLSVSALIPDDYLPDVHTRLVMYKRIASAENHDALRELQVEMIDRFGLLPDAVKNLFNVTEIKLKATPLGITKIEISQESGRIIFTEQPNIDPMKIINLIQTRAGVYKMDGQNKLRITKEMASIEVRLKVINELLDLLSE